MYVAWVSVAQQMGFVSGRNFTDLRSMLQVFSSREGNRFQSKRAYVKTNVWFCSQEAFYRISNFYNELRKSEQMLQIPKGWRKSSTLGEVIRVWDDSVITMLHSHNENTEY